MRSQLEPAQRAGITVLVIEDERSIRDMVARWLTDGGFACRKAADGEVALAILRSQPIDAVISDICMPGCSGLELLPQLREAAPDVAVIMLSALNDAPSAIQALTNGASGYLIKPTTRKALLEEVGSVLASRQADIENRYRARVLESALHLQTREQTREREQAIHQLVAASTFRDTETGAHIQRTALFCEVLAQALGWPQDQVTSIRLAAPLHDVGKIGIPDSILRKPGALTDDEFSVMKTHTTIGGRLLAGSNWPTMQLASEIALSHHEWWNGGGYPFGRRGDAIPIAARLLSIADVYDALTHDRVYRPAFEEGAALEIMHQGVGTQFDPQLFELFEASLPRLRAISQEHPEEGSVEGEQQLLEFMPALVD